MRASKLQRGSDAFLLGSEVGADIGREQAGCLPRRLGPSLGVSGCQWRIRSGRGGPRLGGGARKQSWVWAPTLETHHCLCGLSSLSLCQHLASLAKASILAHSSRAS